MTRDAIIAANPIQSLLTSRGHTFRQAGNELVTKCPLHKDSKPSFSFNPQTNLWKCHAGCGGGSSIDLMARLEGCQPEDILRRYSNGNGNTHRNALRSITGVIPRVPLQSGGDAIKTPPSQPGRQQLQVEKTYSYVDELGREIYQVVRYKPKTFRQRHRVGEGWVWGMEGVRRILYRLGDVLAAEVVWVVEGERDSDSLAELGFVATCNVGGAGKWLDSYTDALAGKDVVLCGDNDTPGQKHVQMVFDSIAGKVKTARIITLPGPHKDVSDFIAATGAEAKSALLSMFNAAQVFTRGINIPLYTIAEIESHYIEYTANLKSAQFDWGSWLPSLGRSVRSSVPGELVAILADTGVGKTAIAQNIAMKARPMNTVFFELELPMELMFERFIGINSGFPCSDVEAGYKGGDTLGFEALSRLKNILICVESRLTSEQIETYINQSELKFGDRPRLVLIDYVGLVRGKESSRYERLSNLAEELKIIAKSTRTVIVMCSQVARKDREGNPEIFLHDAKDSGSIENSSGLVLGAWRDPEDSTLLKIKVLKNTKGRSGFVVDCNFHGNNMRITERSKINESDSANFSTR